MNRFASVSSLLEWEMKKSYATAGALRFDFTLNSIGREVRGRTLRPEKWELSHASGRELDFQPDGQ